VVAVGDGCLAGSHIELPKIERGLTLERCSIIRSAI
jgi:hypothetical protein